MKEDGYRLNVGLIIANKEGKLLLCKRKGMNSWQFPQGGIDYGESALKAAKRELFEEVGIKSKSTKAPSFVSSMFKLYGTEQNKGKYELLLNVLGTQSLGWQGEAFEEDELGTTRAWLRSKANSIEGGTSEVQLNILAKRVLGLPD